MIRNEFESRNIEIVEGSVEIKEIDYITRKRKREHKRSIAIKQLKHCSPFMIIPEEIWNFIFEFIPIGFTRSLEMTCKLFRLISIKQKRILCDFNTASTNVEMTPSYMEWAINVGFLITENTKRHISRTGNLECLEWLYNNGYPLKKETECTIASSNGSKCILKCVFKHGCDLTAQTWYAAASNNNLEILKWLHKKKCPWNESGCDIAAANGYFETLKWLHENGYPLSINTATCAAKGGNINCLKYACNNGCTFNIAALFYSIKNNQMDCLIFLLESGTLLNAFLDRNPTILCTKAAQFGRLEILTYLHTNGYSWNSFTCYEAIKEDYVGCLKYAIENECSFDIIACTETAYSYRSIKCIKYLHEKTVIDEMALDEITF